MIDIILLSAGLIGLIIGAGTDLKKREVPDWLNYSLIAIGLGLRLINSIISSDWPYFLYGAGGFATFLALAYIMFYAGQWGGGDSKMLMAIGAIFATYPLFLLEYFNPILKFPFLIIFLINMLLVGAVYGLVYSLFLAIKHKKRFLEEMRKSKKQYVKARRILLISSALLLLLSFILLKDILLFSMVFLLILIFILTFYIWVFSKVVERACMLKYVEPEKLTEGDWIVENIIVDGKKITGPKDLGVSKEQIKRLIKFKKEKKVDKILIKEGIPFVPSFLVAMIISLIFGNLIFWFV